MSTTSITTAKLQAINANRDRRSLIAFLTGLVSRTIGQTGAHAVPLNAIRQLAAQSTALPTAGNGTSLGLAAAAGSALAGTTTIGSGTASATETAYVLTPLPERYIAGEPVSVRVRAKTSALATVGATINVSAKLVGDAALGSELNAAVATPQALTIAYADYDFVLTPTTLAGGSMLSLTITSIRDDTGGALTGANAIAAVSVRATTAV